MIQEIRTIANSAYTMLFGMEEHVVDLYRAVSDISLDPSTITSVRLKDGTVKSRFYNDVAFITECNRLLVLIEHQATINPNMAFRILEYFVHLAGQYIMATKQDKYGTTEIQIPKAEFYVVYNGKGNIHPLPELDLGDVKVNVKVKDIHFHNLADQSTSNSLAGYARFIELARETQNPYLAADLTKKEGFLSKFLQDEENKNMFAKYFSYDNELINQGIEEGDQRRRIATARTGLREGLDLALISRLSKLSIQAIEELKQSLALNN